MEMKEPHHEMLLGNNESTMIKLIFIPAITLSLFLNTPLTSSAGIILDVPLVLQKPDLSRGCEVASLAMSCEKLE
jgi:hypothetical protein